MSFNIAIDGPAGAGKSTIAKSVAARLGFIYVDTGAMYRSLALYFIRHGIDGSDEAQIQAVLPEISVSLAYEDGAQLVFLNGENVSDYIRTEEVSAMTSKTSAFASVREKLLELQRDMAAKYDVLMDGRDIGTTILPDAQLKVYMTASSAVRAKRRYLEQQARGIECTVEEIERDINERDERDKNRAVSPLKKADDAVILDTSYMTIDEVVAAIEALYKKRVQP